MFCKEISYPFVALNMKIYKCSKAGANAECCHQIEYYPRSEISYGFKTNVYEQKAEQTTAPDSFAVIFVYVFCVADMSVKKEMNFARQQDRKSELAKRKRTVYTVCWFL